MAKGGTRLGGGLLYHVPVVGAIGLPGPQCASSAWRSETAPVQRGCTCRWRRGASRTPRVRLGVVCHIYKSNFAGSVSREPPPPDRGQVPLQRPGGQIGKLVRVELGCAFRQGMSLALVKKAMGHHGTLGPWEDPGGLWPRQKIKTPCPPSGFFWIRAPSLGALWASFCLGRRFRPRVQF